MWSFDNYEHYNISASMKAPVSRFQSFNGQIKGPYLSDCHARFCLNKHLYEPIQETLHQSLQPIHSPVQVAPKASAVLLMGDKVPQLEVGPLPPCSCIDFLCKWKDATNGADLVKGSYWFMVRSDVVPISHRLVPHEMCCMRCGQTRFRKSQMRLNTTWPLLLGWRPSLLGGKPSLLGWRPSLLYRLEAIDIRLDYSRPSPEPPLSRNHRNLDL